MTFFEGWMFNFMEVFTEWKTFEEYPILDIVCFQSV